MSLLGKGRSFQSRMRKTGILGVLICLFLLVQTAPVAFAQEIPLKKVLHDKNDLNSKRSLEMAQAQKSAEEPKAASPKRRYAVRKTGIPSPGEKKSTNSSREEKKSVLPGKAKHHQNTQEKTRIQRRTSVENNLDDTPVPVKRAAPKKTSDTWQKLQKEEKSEEQRLKCSSNRPRLSRKSHYAHALPPVPPTKGEPFCYPFASPQLPVRSALLYNMTTGKILYQHNPHLQIPPASLTKVMTLFLAMDAIKQGKLSLKKRVSISRLAARTGGSSMHLKPGDRVPLSKLLMGTAVASGNDAATAVAQTVNANLQKFVAMMNARAKALGMRKTRFYNPTGLPAQGQMTTVSDMLKLALAYLKKYPDALKFHNVACFTHGGRLLSTTNPLLGSVCGVNGLKTGWTIASGYNIIVTAQRGSTKLMLVVMGGRSRVSRDLTARRLLEAGFKSPNSPTFVRTTFLAKKRARQASRKS